VAKKFICDLSVNGVTCSLRGICLAWIRTMTK
jgi:hypothetical protein